MGNTSRVGLDVMKIKQMPQMMKTKKAQSGRQ
jgi:hypothetical protein